MTATLGAARGGRERLSDSPIRKINLWFIGRHFPPPSSVFVSFRNEQEVGFASYDVKADYFAAPKTKSLTAWVIKWSFQQLGRACSIAPAV
jgi:hypothetical protein